MVNKIKTLEILISSVFVFYNFEWSCRESNDGCNCL